MKTFSKFCSNKKTFRIIVYFLWSFSIACREKLLGVVCYLFWKLLCCLWFFWMFLTLKCLLPRFRYWGCWLKMWIDISWVWLNRFLFFSKQDVYGTKQHIFKHINSKIAWPFNILTLQWWGKQFWNMMKKVETKDQFYKFSWEDQHHHL